MWNPDAMFSTILIGSHKNNESVEGLKSDSAHVRSSTDQAVS